MRAAWRRHRSASNLLAPSAIGLAATEIAKAIASGFRTDLHHHVVSLDLLSSTVVRHHVAARPQCPSCGSTQARDPDRPPLPIRLRVGGKAVMTSGGYRSVAPAETVARFRKHVSPLTGIVSQLERIRSEQPLDFNFVAKHSFSPRPEAVNALQVQVIADSYGKGSTADQAEASALMKAVERHCGIFQGDEIRTIRSFADFPAGDAILPDDILLSGDPPRSIRRPRSNGRRSGRCATSVSSTFRPACCTFFTMPPPQSVQRRLRTAAPPAIRLRKRSFRVSSNSSSGMPVAIWWYNRLQRAEIDLDRLGDSYIRDLRDPIRGDGTQSVGAGYDQRH